MISTHLSHGPTSAQLVRHLRFVQPPAIILCAFHLLILSLVSVAGGKPKFQVPVNLPRVTKISFAYCSILKSSQSLSTPGLDVANVIYAINAGGDAHTDIQGIVYKRDPLSNVAGIASDFGKQLSIQRVHPHDQILYQTERYHTQNFGYNIPIKEEGQYVIGKW